MTIKRAILAAAAIVSAFALGQVFAQARVAAAADLQFVLPECIAAFERANAGAAGKITAVYGSSGNLFAQIQAGAPYDVFLSADTLYPERLRETGLTAGAPFPFAVGHLVAWFPSGSPLDVGRGLEALRSPQARRVAIANPEHAPYGKRAREALQYYNLWDAVRQKLLLADNAAQAAHYLQTGNAEAGVIPLSLALSPPMSKAGKYSLIDDRSHARLEQRGALIKRGAASPGATAQAFAEFLRSAAAVAIFGKYGFAPPR